MADIEVARRSASGSFILFTGNIISATILAVTAIVVTRLLGPAGIGAYTLLLVLPNLLQSFVGLGINIGITRYAALHLSKGEPEVARRLTFHGLIFIFVSGIFLFLVALGGSFYVSSFVLHRPELTGLSEVASSLILVQTLFQSVNAALLGFGAMRAIGLSTIALGIPFGPINFAEAAGNYSAVVLQDSPAAYWRFGDAVGSTTAADASGHNLALTYQGSAALGQPGAVVGDANTAVQFSGTNRYASRATAPLTATTNWSLEAWIYPTSLPQLGAVIYNGIDDSSHGGYGFEIASSAGTSGSNIIGIPGSAGVINSGYTLPAASRWYHVVMTRDTTTIRFYVNGQQSSSTSTTSPATPGA